MINQCYINDKLTELQVCSSSFAVRYVDCVRYGYEDESKKLLSKMVILKGMIRLFQEYELSNDVYVDNGILNRFGKKIVLSKNNLLSLESKSNRICLTGNQINCLTEDQIYRLEARFNLICATC